MLSDIASSLTLIAMGILIYSVKNYIYPYLQKKAENIAQKEDIKELTRLVEDVRAKYTKEIEFLKSKLDRTNVVHRIQFEAEFRLYQDLSKFGLATVRDFVRLRPTPQSGLLPPEDGKSRFSNSQLEFCDCLDASEPFIPREVFAEFSKFKEVLVKAKVDIFYADPTEPESDEERKATRKAILEGLQASSAAIQRRLSTVLVE